MSRYVDVDEIRKRYKEPYLDADLDTVPSADVIERSVVMQPEEHAYDCGMEKGSEICQECGKYKRGEWVPFEYGDDTWHKCSVCGTADKYIDKVPRPNGTIGTLIAVRNFCPTCGADMRGKENEIDRR